MSELQERSTEIESVEILSDLDRKILKALIVPDIAGRDDLGRSAMWLFNGQMLQQQPIERPYFVRAAS